MAILAPELVAWNAFEQRRQVNGTTKAVRLYIGHVWTDTHSWFAIIGGFAFDISNAPETFFPDGRRRLTITADGIQVIAKQWPHLLLQSLPSSEDIRDKSKADGLAKVLACWQATWFCVQCIFRLSSGLTISLLELNVFGHAICALLIYIIWWGKPQDVTQPHVFVATEAYEAAAVLCTGSKIGKLHLISPEARQYYDRFHKSYGGSPKLCDADDLTIELRGPAAIALVHPSLTESQLHYAFPSLKVDHACWQFDVRWLSLSKKSRPHLLVDEYAYQRLKCGKEASVKWLTLVQPRCGDWSIFLGGFNLFLDPAMAMCYSASITLANAAYGGLHVTAFWALFPSKAEQLLWRMSSLTVVVFGATFSIFWTMVEIVDDEDVPAAILFISAAFAVLSLIWYFFCRAFLVVECFISLAYLVPSQLTIPTWSKYIPHLS